MKNEKYLICYHANCIDGWASAWACARGLFEVESISKSDITLRAVNYNDDQQYYDEEIQQYSHIYFVDFSVSVAVLQQLCTHTVRVYVVDHHKTARDMYLNDPNVHNIVTTKNEDTDEVIKFTGQMAQAFIIFNINESGATLTWKYFFGGYLPRLLWYIRDYDLWKFEDSATNYINRYLRIQEKDLMHWNLLQAKFEDEYKLQEIIKRGKAIHRYHLQLVADYVEQADKCFISGEEGFISNCSKHFADDVGQELAKRSGTFGCTYSQMKEGRIQFSLRSIGDYDVSELAKKHGGGGHKNAAGFILSQPSGDTIFPDEDSAKGIEIWHI